MIFNKTEPKVGDTRVIETLCILPRSVYTKVDGRIVRETHWLQGSFIKQVRRGGDYMDDDYWENVEFLNK